MDALEQAHVIWAEVQNTSKEANRAYRFLNRIIPQLASEVNKPSASPSEAEETIEQDAATDFVNTLGEDFQWGDWDAYFREIELDQPLSSLPS